LEASLVNARLKKRTWGGGFSVGLVGEAVDLTYNYEHLGDKAHHLEFLKDANHAFTQKLVHAQNPMIILGESVFTHADHDKIVNLVKAFCLSHNLIRIDWNGYNVLATSAATVGASDLDFLPQQQQQDGHDLETIYKACESGEIKTIYVLGADQLDFSRLKNAFIIYQGNHGDEGASHANVIVPGAAYTEKHATYVRLRKTGRLSEHSHKHVESHFPLMMFGHYVNSLAGIILFLQRTVWRPLTIHPGSMSALPRQS
jgi:NADH-quinone oxidoreductase subunit G